MKIAMAMIIATILSFLITPVIIKIAKRFGAMDVPKDERRVHNKSMPLWGGLAIYISFFVVLFIFGDMEGKKFAGLFIASTIIIIMGMIDDVKDLSAKRKLLVQIIAAGILVYAGYEINFFTNYFGQSDYIHLGMFSVPISILWIVGVTNTVNLIDGLDGLAAGLSAIAALTLGYIAFANQNYDAALITLILAGSTLGFLPYNFNPAKIFMGDTGALFLGLVLAAISVEGTLKGATALTIVVPILALGVPIFDTAFAIIRRALHRKPIMQADKGHLHHRMLASGLNQKRAVLSMYFLGALMGAGAIEISKQSWVSAGIFLLTALIVIVIPVNRSIMIEKENELDEMSKRDI